MMVSEPVGLKDSGNKTHIKTPNQNETMQGSKGMDRAEEASVKLLRFQGRR